MKSNLIPAKTWKSASEQVELPVEAELRRISEWPVGLKSGSFHLYGIDPFGITLESSASAKRFHYALPPNVTLPTRRYNVLLCGAAAAIVDCMLTQGSRLTEECPPKHEPLLLLCVQAFPANPAMIRSGIDVARLLLRDSGTRIDAVVWYDINHTESRLDLALLKRECSAKRPSVPILVLDSFPSLQSAVIEHAAAFSGHLMEPARDLYIELIKMIESGKDCDPYGYLQSIP